MTFFYTIKTFVTSLSTVKRDKHWQWGMAIRRSTAMHNHAMIFWKILIYQCLIVYTCILFYKPNNTLCVLLTFPLVKILTLETFHQSLPVALCLGSVEEVLSATPPTAQVISLDYFHLIGEYLSDLLFAIIIIIILSLSHK